MLTSNTTPAALFRAIEKFQPTLVIDEADSFFGENEELRGLINSGHTRETAFKTLRPGLPEALNDRQQDNWDHLFGVADLAGAAWPDKAREAAMAICGAAEEASSGSTVQLLSDIRAIFKEQRASLVAEKEKTINTTVSQALTLYLSLHPYRTNLGASAATAKL